MTTFGSLFSGGGGVDIGAKLAGLAPAWAVEVNPAIAEVARQNGLHVLTADVRDVDFTALPRVDVLHASPPCIRYSRVTDKEIRFRPTEEDLQLVQAVVRAARVLQPEVITVENVVNYRKSEAWASLVRGLESLKYTCASMTVHFAKCDVPQSRMRHFVIATRTNQRIHIPPRATLSWFAAVEDLTDTLVEAPLPSAFFRNVSSTALPWLRRGTWLAQAPYGNLCVRGVGQPAMTVTSDMARARIVRDGTSYAVSLEVVRRLQTFPDWYRIAAPKSVMWKIFANAVPPVGYAHILRCVL